MKNVKPPQATVFQLKPLLPPPPPPPPTLPSIPAEEFRPCSVELKHLHLLPAAATSHTNDFPHLLKACASLGLLPLGLVLHQRAIVFGLAGDSYISTSLLHMYAMNHRIHNAQQVFDIMPVRNVVPYSALISAYSRLSYTNTAFSIYNMMLNDGIRPNSVTLLGMLSGISELDRAECLHALLVRFGFEDDLIVVNSIINVYSLCERTDLARALFDSMAFRDRISWNSMVAGYSRIGAARNSMDLLHEMRLERFFPDQQTYASLLASLASNNGCSAQWGRRIHAAAVTSGFGSDHHLVTTLISMYLKFSNSDHAFKLFERSPEKDVVLWTAMISGLAQNRRANEALIVFHQMMASSQLMPLNETISSTASACAQLGLLRIGASVHGFAIRQQLALDNAAENSLVTLYAKCGRLGLCRTVFESMKVRDLVSWNAVVSGYAHNSHLEEAFHLFARMVSADQRPDAVTVVSLLQGCAVLGALDEGKLIHNFLIRHELSSCLSMETSLVDMYSKCGLIKTAQSCFDRMLEQDVVSWSAIIAGYASHGMGETALMMYSDFLRTGMKPNGVMLLSVLSACSHSGLVAKGLAIFSSMKEELGIEPQLEHCACVVDLLCRAGNAEEGLRFFRAMSPEANADVLGIVLDACKASDCAYLSEEVVKEMRELRPESAGNYVRLAHSYAAMNHRDGVKETLRRMRASGLKKTPGWSFVELSGRKCTFFADDASHPQRDEIMWLMNVLGYEMKGRNDDHL